METAMLESTQKLVDDFKRAIEGLDEKQSGLALVAIDDWLESLMDDEDGTELAPVGREGGEI